ncbi:MAG TPA: DUF1996 domain-containing protein [Thermoleophilaceae bacterium]|nr:DUF1996 domain-containing protein [Thermoleophilaceae bacterium]
MKRYLGCGFAVLLVLGFGTPASAVDPDADFADGYFKVTCSYSHTAHDDPIVSFGNFGAAHRHDFFGNTSTRADSTLTSLRAADTTCNRTADLSAYWVPALHAPDGTPQIPINAVIYYANGKRSPFAIEPFPAGFKMIAGDAHATAPQSINRVHWQCTPQQSSGQDPAALTCAPGSSLRVGIHFPDCWDGHFDGGDETAHMAYSTHISGVGKVCPTSFSRSVPKISMFVTYRTSGGPGYYLSAGKSTNTGHADFFNAWDDATQLLLIQSCLHTGQQCHGPTP